MSSGELGPVWREGQGIARVVGLPRSRGPPGAGRRPSNAAALAQLPVGEHVAYGECTSTRLSPS